MTTTVIVILGVAGLLIGLATIWLAVWSKYGITKKIVTGFEDVGKGFSDIKTSTSIIGHDLDKRMSDLVAIIKYQAQQKQKGTVIYELTNLGHVEISVIDMEKDVTTYDIKAKQAIFTSGFLVGKANEDKDLQEKERVLFGEEQPILQSLIPTLLRVQIPSRDKEKCSKYMAILLQWLDTKYFQDRKELAEAESDIGQHMDSGS